jgi:hypothetical protein
LTREPSRGASDFLPSLERAIRIARDAGLEDSARELEERSRAAGASAAEFLGEVGLAIVRFRAREGRRVPPEAARLLDECQREAGRAWPLLRPGPLYAFLRRLRGIR